MSRGWSSRIGRLVERQRFLHPSDVINELARERVGELVREYDPTAVGELMTACAVTRPTLRTVPLPIESKLAATLYVEERGVLLLGAARAGVPRFILTPHIANYVAIAREVGHGL